MTGWQKGNYELKTKNHERPDSKPPRSFADLVPLPTGSYPVHTNIMRLIEHRFINPKPGCLCEGSTILCPCEGVTTLCHCEGGTTLCHCEGGTTAAISTIKH